MVGGPPSTTMANRFTGMGVLCHRERARDNWPDHTGRVRLPERGLIVVGDALAQVMLTAPLLP